MRPSYRQPRPHAEDIRLRAPEPPSRKVFNTIVDDTALVAGVKKSTRDGIKKWIESGAIRLFVPLHTLQRVNTLKGSGGRVAQDANDATAWLDDVTSMPSIVDTGRVILEGTDDKYKTWNEVEKLLLPETLFSQEEDHYDEVESLGDDLDGLSLQDSSDRASVGSSIDLHTHQEPSSPNSTCSSTAQAHFDPIGTPANTGLHSSASTSPARTARNSGELDRAKHTTKPAVPVELQELFNYIMWTVNHFQNAVAGIDSFILLTNDPVKQSLCQRFGIRAKRLEQLRDVINREDRDYRNRMNLFNKEHSIAPRSPPKQAVELVDDEDEVLVKGRSPRNSHGPQGKLRLFDPNAPQVFNPRGGRGVAPRGRGGRGRGGQHHMRGGAFMPLAPPVQNQNVPVTSRMSHDPKQPIDPDDFSRPSPAGRGFRGGRKQLWTPT